MTLAHAVERVGAARRGLALARALPARVRFWLTCIAVFVVVGTIDRAYLIGHTWSTDGRYSPSYLLALAPGLLDDLATGILLGVPFAAGLYLFASVLRGRWGVGAAHAILLAMLFLLAFSEALQIYFWNEFDSRFNGVAVHYAAFPREVLGNVQESFDVWPVLLACALAAAVLYLPLRRRLTAAVTAPPSADEWRPAVLVVAGAVAVAVPVYATVSPLDSHDRNLNELAANSMHSLLRAALADDAAYDGVYPTLPEAAARAGARALVEQDNTRFLDGRGPNPLWRHIDNGSRPIRPNVVLVVAESFGSTYVDGLDNDGGESISPNLARLARDGLLFTNIHATGTRTVRGLEAVLTSFPPIPGISTSRRPGSDGMNSLPFMMKRLGYRTAFLYGGRASFDDMGRFWKGIGFDRIWEQDDIADRGFSTVWGVADEYLFGEALKRLDAETAKGPVLMGLLTVSNHRPYAYPDGRIAKPSGQKRRENAATYADWAFGDFIERARARPWFDDTIFVFIGDHAPRLQGAGTVPVPSYRVPLLFYAPKLIAAARDGTLGSSLDVGPTLLGLIGASYASPFFGVDLRRVKPGQGRVVMAHNFDVAFGDGRNVAVMRPSAVAQGYAMRVGPTALEPRDTVDGDALFKLMALTQTAHRLFYGRAYHDLARNKSSGVLSPVTR